MMVNTRSFLLFVIGILLHNYTFSDQYHINLSFQSAILDINDPDGNTDTDTLFIPRIQFGYDLSREYQLFGFYSVYDADLNEGVEQIGQKGEAELVGFGVQKRFPLNENIKIWFGASIFQNKVNWTNRFSVDTDGFISTRFHDRKTHEVGIELSVDGQYQFLDKYYVGLGSFLDVVDSTQIYGFRLSVGI